MAQERREKACRDKCDIGQKDVAAAIGSSPPSVSRWESGVGGPPSDAMVERLAAYFGVTPSWLRYGQEPRHAPTESRPVKPIDPSSLVPVPRSQAKKRKAGGR